MKKSIFTLLAILVSLSAIAQRGWQKVGEIRQDISVHDPVMIMQDSVYYLFCTGRGIGRYRSTDMKNWERLPGVFEEAPDWVMEKLPEFRNHIWAPDVAYHNGRYVLFYSVSRFGKNTSCIGMVSTPSLHPDDPNYEWTDHGPVICSIPGEDDWNAIDPNLIFDEEGQPWMSFGSFWGGMQLFLMSADLTGPKGEGDTQVIATRGQSERENILKAGDGAIEAPFMIKRGDWYYLFVSFDFCCRGENSTYNIRVGRSKQVTGPFLDKDGVDMVDGGGSLVLKGNERYAGVGHNAVENFGGQDYLICHGYDLEAEGHSRLLIFPMEWSEDLWPVVSWDQ